MEIVPPSVMFTNPQDERTCRFLTHILWLRRARSFKLSALLPMAALIRFV